VLPRFIKLSEHPGNLDPTARLIDCQPYAGVYQTANGFVGTLPDGMAFEGYFATREEAKSAVQSVMDGFKRSPK
jgi:hypothetical protein